MNRKLLLSISLLLVCFFTKAQNVTIPDANFKAYLVGNSAINTNSDTEIQVSEAEAFTGTIDCSGKNITNLTGIEAFTKITELYCSDNQLTTLDVSKNTALTTLWCFDNQLTALDVSKNTTLIELYVWANQLTTLDVSKNILLEGLHVPGNQFTTLDVSKNILLEELNVSDNQFTTLDVSKNTALITLWCFNNQLTALDVSKNTALTQLNCVHNQLTSLNIKNGNNRILLVNAIDNPNLTCIRVDNVPYANAQNSWGKDVTASYCTDLSTGPIVNIPDANFKAYLLTVMYADADGDGEIQVSEAETFTGFINCPSKGIADLTGIEAFTNITELYCSDNQLTTLDVSKNTALTTLWCFDNQLTTLDLSQNTALTNLWCYRNKLTALDVSKNTALKSLSADRNQLTTLDISKNTALTELSVWANQLTTLDVSKNILLEGLYVSDNQLTSLNLKNGNNNMLSDMDATNNPNLTCIQVDNATNANTNGGWYKDATASYNENCGYVLPVTLITFTAKANGNHALLQWKTTNEVNNKGFEIYRGAERLEGGTFTGSVSVEGFVKIGEVPASNISNLTSQTYSFTDKNPLNGNNYYKLVQIDNDGKATELGVRTVNFGLSSSDIRLFPNPTTNKITVVFGTGQYNKATLTNISGKVLKRLNIGKTDGSANMELSDLPSGTYLLHLTGYGKPAVQKVVKL